MRNWRAANPEKRKAAQGRHNTKRLAAVEYLKKE
jgi:hypothetical protein